MATSTLVLVRHAKSDYPWGVDDHDRPLNERGRRDAPLIGTWVDEHVSWTPGAEPAILVSTALRAQLTWSLARPSLSDRWASAVEIDEARIYEASSQTLGEVVADHSTDASTVILVGHNPGLVGLILALAEADDRRAAATAKFPTSAIAVLESDLPLPDAAMQPQAFRVREFAVPRG